MTSCISQIGWRVLNAANVSKGDVSKCLSCEAERLGIFRGGKMGVDIESGTGN